jgi:hypothetical protein
MSPCTWHHISFGAFRIARNHARVVLVAVHVHVLRPWHQLHSRRCSLSRFPQISVLMLHALPPGAVVAAQGQHPRHRASVPRAAAQLRLFQLGRDPRRRVPLQLLRVRAVPSPALS